MNKFKIIVKKKEKIPSFRRKNAKIRDVKISKNIILQLEPKQ